jgi:hypothetical protein
VSPCEHNPSHNFLMNFYRSGGQAGWRVETEKAEPQLMAIGRAANHTLVATETMLVPISPWQVLFSRAGLRQRICGHRDSRTGSPRSGACCTARPGQPNGDVHALGKRKDPVVTQFSTMSALCRERLAFAPLEAESP